MSSPLKVGFLGAGRMATALAKGFLQAGLTTADQLVSSDPSEAARKAFQREAGGTITTSNVDVLRAARIIVLAVKPDQVAAVLGEVSPAFTTEHLLVSIAAGVPLARMEAALP